MFTAAIIHNFILCADRLPDLDTIVIITDGRTVNPGYRCSKNDGEWYWMDVRCDAACCFIVPYMWTPLPAIYDGTVEWQDMKRGQ